MQLQTLEDLLVHQLKDLYSAEQQILKALPKMAEAASSTELKAAFETHEKETQTQIEMLEKVAEEHEYHLNGHKCKAMEGIILEGEEILKMKSEIPSDILDAALISSAQRVEHYEIAGYGTVRSLAEQLGNDEAADVFQEILDQESATDEKLSIVAESLAQIMQEED